MELETPKMPTQEEAAEIIKIRKETDRQMMREGARWKVSEEDNLYLVPTEEQIHQVKREMDHSLEIDRMVENLPREKKMLFELFYQGTNAETNAINLMNETKDTAIKDKLQSIIDSINSARRHAYTTSCYYNPGGSKKVYEINKLSQEKWNIDNKT